MTHAKHTPGLHVEAWQDGKISITEDNGGDVVAWMEPGEREEEYTELFAAAPETAAERDALRERVEKLRLTINIAYNLLRLHYKEGDDEIRGLEATINTLDDETNETPTPPPDINAEILGALKRLLRAFESDKERIPGQDILTSWETNSQAIDRARALIAKAEGR